MPQKLALCFVLLTSVTACTVQPAPVEAPPCPCQQPYAELQEWLALSARTTTMETSEIVAELVKLGRPQDATEKFYFGLLNQQLSTAANWRQARNAFREIRRDTALNTEQRRLAGILEQHNIGKLDNNADRKGLLRTQASLEASLAEKSQENLQLLEKIRAITDVEESMSTRIEQEQ